MTTVDRCQLQSWLDEFQTAGFPTTGYIKVIEQDDETVAHDGLVVVQLSGAATVTYLQFDDSLPSPWRATMEPREDTIDLDAAGLLRLSAELAVLSSLCSFLHAKTTSSAGILTSDPVAVEG